MSKNRNLDHQDILEANWTDGLQEFISTLASNLALTQTSINQVRIEAGSGSDQVGIGIDGRWRYNTANVTVAHPAGNAGIVHNIWVVANENSYTPGAPGEGETDNTDYSFGVVILPTGTNPSGNHNGSPIVAYRKVGETDWDGTNITGLRKAKQLGGMQPMSAIASWATHPALVARGAASQSADIFRVENSSQVAILSVTAGNGVEVRRGAGAQVLLNGRVVGDANPRLEFLADGTMKLGPGNAVADITIARESAQVLSVSSRLHVLQGVEVDGALDHDGTTVGFYGKTPIVVNATPFTNTAGLSTTTFDLPVGFTLNQLGAVLMTLLKQLGDANGVGLVNTSF